MIKLIVSDIDGTVLKYGQAQVDEDTLAAFEEAVNAGLYVGPASGRAYSWIANIFRQRSRCYQTAIAANGLQAYVNGERIVEQLIEREPLEHTIELLRDFPHAGLIVYGRTNTPFFCCGDINELRQCFPPYADAVKILPGLPEGDITKANLFIHGDLSATVEITDFMKSHEPSLDYDVPQPGFSNIMPRGWGKGMAVKKLCEHLDIDPSEVVAFGDGGNDVSLFEFVGHPVAVADAAPEAKAVATYEIGRCEDAAVAQTIRQIIKGEFPPQA